MQNVLILSNSAYADVPYDRWLPASQFRLFFLVAEEVYPQYAHLPNVISFANYVQNPQVLRTGLDLLASQPFAAVIARGEMDVQRAAVLRAQARIPGQKSKSARQFRDKLVMKQTLRAAGVPVADYMPVASLPELTIAVEQLGFPCVLKPLDGSGSAGTRVLKTWADVAACPLEYPQALLLESFVPGQMYHVNGIVYRGEILFSSVHAYVNDCLSFQRGGFIGSYVVKDASPQFLQRVTDFNAGMLSALEPPACATFHTEIFHTPDDRLVACETASRPPGGRICRELLHAWGIHLDEVVTKLELGLIDPAELRVLPKSLPHTGGHLIIYPRKGVLTSGPEHCPLEWVREMQRHGAIGAEYHGGEKSGRGLYTFVVTTPPGEIVSRIHQTHDWLTGQWQWSTP